MPDNPFLELLGARLVHWDHGQCEWQLDIAPHHLNSQGSLQGGVIATLLDVACGYSVFFHAADEPPARTATISLTIHYLARVDGGRVVARGRQVGGGKAIFFAEAELLDEVGGTIAKASGSFRSFRSKRRSDPGRSVGRQIRDTG